MRDDLLHEGLLVVKPSGQDGSHCGITDLYDDFEERIKAAWKQGDFYASWDSKKELLHANITKVGGAVTISVNQSCDEGIELITDTMGELGYPGEDTKAREILDDESFPRYVLAHWEEDMHGMIQVNEPSFTETRVGRYRTLYQALQGIAVLVTKTEAAIELNSKMLREFIIGCVESLRHFDQAMGDEE
jgi:hypothetical protein